MRQIIKEFGEQGMNYNCAENIIYAASKKYDLNLPAECFKMCAAYGAGMHTGSSCGVILAAISVLGILYTDGVCKTSPKLKPAVTEFIERFTKEHTSSMCSFLKEGAYPEEEGCASLIGYGADLLEEIIEKHNKL